MSTFTTTFAEAVRFTGGTAEYVDGRTVLTGTAIGLEHYPIFDEAHRTILNSHIADEFWNREIAHETVAVFRQRLSAHMMLHMPIFNKRYELALRDFDPLVTMDIQNTGSATGTQSAESEAASVGESEGKAGTRNVYSDTPGSMLKGNAAYATNATDATNYTESDSSSTDTSTTTASSDSETVSRSVGYTGIPSDLIGAAQAALLNVDLMVVDSLQPLFFQLWGNSDEYLTRGY